MATLPTCAYQSTIKSCGTSQIFIVGWHAQVGSLETENGFNYDQKYYCATTKSKSEEEIIRNNIIHALTKVQQSIHVV